MLENSHHNYVALDYHENTLRINNHGKYDPHNEYKVYPSAKVVSLDAMSPETSDFTRILSRRESCRSFSPDGISLKQLGQLLSLSCGLNHRKQNEVAFRTYASAGARYPIEIYPAILHSDDLEQGIYHFNVLDNTLELIQTGNFTAELNAFYGNQPFDNVPCYLLFSMVYERTMQKYGDRGYRFIYLDAGHMSQNLYLVAEYLGLGAVAIGGGSASDEEIDYLLRINRMEERFFYGVAVGKVSG